MHTIIKRFFFIGIFFFFLSGLCHSQVSIGFISPDTTCTGQLISITDTTSGGTTFYWNFCSGDANSAPTGINIGNPGGLLSIPTYLTLVKQNNDCFSFISCQGVGVVRYFHGNSFAHNPVSWVNLGTFGGLINFSEEGIAIKKDNGNWYGFVNSYSTMIRLNFGTSLWNTPTATDLNISPAFYMAHGLDLVNDNGNWVALVGCSLGASLFRLNFGNSLANAPVVTNLGNLGCITGAASVCIKYENSNWYAMVVAGSNTLARISFGSSLLNTPTGVNLGNPGGFNSAIGLAILRDCNATTGYWVNYINPGQLGKLFFPTGITGTVTGTILGNIGNLNQPHSFSEVFRQNDTLFAYITNRPGTLTRLTFPPCNNSTVPSSNQYNPPPFSYNLAGTYNIRLIVDEGLPTQASLCKPIVIVPPPTMDLGPDKTICQGDNVVLDAGAGFSSYLWSTGATTQMITVNAAGTYWARGTRYGCQVSDTVVLTADPVNINFIAPDTACVGASINITNLTTCGTTYYWSFCSGNATYDPEGINIGNPGYLLDVPAYIFLAEDNHNCYSFITNHGTRSLVRCYHGSNFNNNPVSWTNLGTFGMLGDTVEGIRILKDNGQWIGIINNNNRLLRLNFGNSLANTPTATLLGPYSMLYSAHCLEILNENGNWVGYLTCTWGNKLVRLSFGSSLLNTPVLTDLGNFGGILNMPSRFSIVRENGNWYAIVVNSGNSTHARLAFGNSLYNDPTATSLGQVCGSIPLGGIVLLRDCNETTGFQLNYTANTSTGNEIYRLNFPGGLQGNITGTPIGNIGNMNRPNEFSQIVRVGDTLFAYVTNRQDYTLTRLKFLPCSNASTGSSTQYNPPPFSYNQTGTYNVQLIADEGLPTQASLCKPIVIVPTPTMDLGPDKTICQGATTTLDAGAGFSSYLWSTGDTTRTITVGTGGTYWARGTRYGCQASDTILVFVMPLPVPTISGPPTVCAGSAGHVYTTESSMSNYSWNISAGGMITSGSGTNSVTVTWNLPGSQTISVVYTDNNGCSASNPTTDSVSVIPLPSPALSGPAYACVASPGNIYYTQAGMSNYMWTVSPGGSITSGGTSNSNSATVTWNTSGQQNISVSYTNPDGCAAASPANFNVTVNPIPGPAGNIQGASAVCAGTDGLVYSVFPVENASAYVWILPPGFSIISGAGTISITVGVADNAAGGSITVYGINPCGAGPVSPPFEIIINHQATANAGEDISGCGNRPVLLSGSNADHFVSLQWMTSGSGTFDNAAVLHPTYFPGASDIQNGQVILTLFAYSSPPCDPDSDQLILTLGSGPSVTPGPDGYICQGMSYTIQGFGITNSSTFSWESNGKGQLTNTNTLNPVYTPAGDELGSVKVTLKVSGINGCSDSSASSQIQIFIYSKPGIKAGREQLVKYDSAAVLSCETSGGSGNFSFDWSPAAMLVDNTLPNPHTVSLIKDALFIITITDKVTGCIATDSTWIRVTPEPEDEDCIVIHNVITPNGDGINDKLIIDCIEEFPENTLELFNRWGEPVNSFTNYNNKDVVWGGTTSKGEILPDGTYFFILQIRDGKKYTGWVFIRSGTN